MIIQKVYDPSRRHDYEEWEDVCGTLENRMGTGGGNVPIVVQTFNQISQSAGYKDDEVAVNLTVCGGSYGGQRSACYTETVQ